VMNMGDKSHRGGIGCVRGSRSHRARDGQRDQPGVAPGGDGSGRTGAPMPASPLSREDDASLWRGDDESDGSRVRWRPELAGDLTLTCSCPDAASVAGVRTDRPRNSRLAQACRSPGS
jgi:hypothetical protein